MNIGEPCSYEEAIVASDAETWQQVMISEMDSIQKNNTWKLVELPASRKPLPCKWVYRHKYVSSSAQIAAKGFK